ncbi:mitochondrial import inner membrane translocase subunit Tim9-like [Ptychodera flava]|uniref:mitochondrial import inner membrane translocase subunit Tim9-like n=1 Tax=Ptychodera flava TaxID=63121 RepID=UPI003969F912
MAMKLTPQQQQQAEVKQFREFLLSYNRLSEMCFTDCVNDLTTRKVTDSEDSCAQNCMDKYLKMTQRISQRFQEYQVQQNEHILASQKGLAGR